MTTKKDLVEAHAFSRRRLVTAFLSGAPGGREVEPSRPGRTIVAGVALAVLLVAGAAIASVLAPRTADGWDSQGVVVSKDTGQRYLIVGDSKVLRPVINVTSAQLVLGMNYQLTIVSQKTLAASTPGPDIGILGAPPQLPEESAFVSSGWTACTSAGAGIAVDVAAAPQVSSLAGHGLLATTTHGGTWLIAEGTQAGARAYRYSLGSRNAQQLFAGGVAPDEITVSQSWLNLFPESTLAVPQGMRAIRNANGAGYDIVQHNLYESVGPFAAYVVAGLGRPPVGTVGAAQLNGSGTSLLGDLKQIWPDQLLTAIGPGPVCAQLQATSGEPSEATLAAPMPGTTAWPSQAPSATSEPVVRVDPSAGAFVRSAGSPAHAPGTTFMVASTGQKYLLSDPTTLQNLGLASYAAPTVSPAWMSLFQSGPELAARKALCQPELTGAPRC